MPTWRVRWVIGILLVVMVLHLLAMLYSQPIMRRFALPLRVLGAVWAYCRCIGLQIMTSALQKIGVVE